MGKLQMPQILFLILYILTNNTHGKEDQREGNCESAFLLPHVYMYCVCNMHGRMDLSNTGLILRYTLQMLLSKA